MTTPGGPRECPERVQGRDEAGGGGQDADQPGACVTNVVTPAVTCHEHCHVYQVRVASVVDITGRRLQLSYDEGGDGFWCHEESPLIHPVGPCHASHVTLHSSQIVMLQAGRGGWGTRSARARRTTTGA